jgi:GNAT superfamily N-acetyltransferase
LGRFEQEQQPKSSSNRFVCGTAFFTTLRANLTLDLEQTSSAANTLDILRPVDWTNSDTLYSSSSASLLGQYSEMADDDDTTTTFAETPGNLLDSLPELTTKPAVIEDDRVEALHLIADSVAQQRQLASTAIIFHPFTLCALVLLFGLAYQNLYKGSYSDWAIVGTTSAGILMAVLISVRWLTGGYIFEAERIGTWKWLNEGRDGDSEHGIVGSQDDILLTRYGDEVIGAIVLRGVRNPTSPLTGKSRKNLPPTTGHIRAWTVKRRYRRKGIGQGLLEEAVAWCRDKGWQGPEFADDHANSAKIVHPTFTGGFRRRERQAHEMLQRVIEEQGSSGNASGKKGRR